MRARTIVGLLVLGLLGLVSCGGSDSPESASDAPTAVAADPTPEPEPSAVAADPTPEPDLTATAADPTPAPDLTAAPEPEPEPEPAAVATASAGCGVDAPVTLDQMTIEFEGRERTAELVVPSAYDGITPLPLVLNWHGRGSNGAQQLAFSEYPGIAEREGFIVVAPDGLVTPGDTAAGWEIEGVLGDLDPTRDDVAFANHLLDTLQATLCIDPSRTYSTGMSNGGYFTAMLVCEMADRIAAAASIAGFAHPEECNPARAVPTIAFHGTADATVPYAGGGESDLLPPGALSEIFEPAIPDEFADLAAEIGCEAEPDPVPVGDSVTAHEYTGCVAEMTFYEIRDGGHTWPGSLISAVISDGAGLGFTNTEVSATELSWEFFSRHTLSD